MKTFISYSRADEVLANQFAELLQMHYVPFFLDERSAGGGKLGTVVQVPSNHAMFAPTKSASASASFWSVGLRSGWVPYEIGVAKQAPRVIKSMTNLPDSQLPAYLMEWPRLRGDAAIDRFAVLYKRQKQTLTESVLEKRATASNQLSAIDSFHQQLKNQLGQ